MQIFIFILIIIWLIGWIHQWAFTDAMLKKFEGNKDFDNHPEIIKAKKYPKLIVIILFFTWPYFYFYWKY